MMDERTISIKRICIFLGVNFLITYLYEIFFVVRYLQEHPEHTIASIASRVAIAMFFPALSAVITRVVTGEGMADAYIKPVLKGGKYKYYLMAWFLPGIITALGTIVYFVIFNGDYSADMTYIIDTYAKQGTPGITKDIMLMVVISQGVTAFLLGPILNCITCFGEEWGWRGYLLPKMLKVMPMLPTLIISGVIWGLWHAPIIVAGHNYGLNYVGYPYNGILMMCVFCTSVGILLSYVTIKSGSCVPAIIGHGAINSIASIGIFFTKNGGKQLLGPAPTGIVGGIFFVILAVVLACALIKSNEKEK